MQTTDPLCVHVFHEDPVMAAGLVAVLERQSDLFVREASGAQERAGAGTRNDVVVTGYESGLDFLRRHRSADPRGAGSPPRVLVVTHRARESEVRSALNAGVRGYVIQGLSLIHI